MAKAVADELASMPMHGYRSLGVARAEPEGAWRLLGVLALADPPRTDSAATIPTARDLGYRSGRRSGRCARIHRGIGSMVSSTGRRGVAGNAGPA